MGSVTLDRVDWNKVAPDRSSDICSFLDIHLPSISDNLVSCCDPMCKGSFMSNHALDLPLDSAPQKLSSLKQIREPCSTALLQVPPTPRIRWWIMINSTLFLLTETCELRSSQMALSLSFAPICHHSHPPAQKTQPHPNSHSYIRPRAIWSRCPTRYRVWKKRLILYWSVEGLGSISHVMPVWLFVRDLYTYSQCHTILMWPFYVELYLYDEKKGRYWTDIYSSSSVPLNMEILQRDSGIYQLDNISSLSKQCHNVKNLKLILNWSVEGLGSTSHGMPMKPFVCKYTASVTQDTQKVKKKKG